MRVRLIAVVVLALQRAAPWLPSRDGFPPKSADLRQLPQRVDAHGERAQV